tara:strand:- start:386 stop:700 length:315 start_codon:yes stop_codon:yes gene_type:complete
LNNKFNIGNLVTCYYRTIPPSPNWNPFIEGRPAIITKVIERQGRKDEKTKRYFYDIVVISYKGSISTRTIHEDNLIDFVDAPDLEKQMKEEITQYFANKTNYSD